MARGGIGLRLMDGALPVLGLVLLVIGATGVKLAVVFAWGVLALSFLGWLAEANGLPRPGRLPIRSYGCWETPLAFGVCHQGRELLFSREEDEHGAWSSDYTVRERKHLSDADPRFELPGLASGGWAMRGRTPVDSLRFEHLDRASFVTRRSLERALSSAGAASR